MVKQKNIATAIILSIITCGIYFYIWLYDITESVNAATNKSYDIANDYDDTANEFDIAKNVNAAANEFVITKNTNVAANRFKISSNRSEITPGMAVLLIIITCGLYSIYWSYKMGKQIYEARLVRGMNANDNSILYLILSILGLNIINFVLMQSDLNEMA